jgi:hypothetical protein
VQGFAHAVLGAGTLLGKVGLAHQLAQHAGGGVKLARLALAVAEANGDHAVRKNSAPDARA